MHNHTQLKYLNLRPEVSLKDLAAFHGHLGPYIVIGYRIGAYAREHFCDNPFDMNAYVYCAGRPPESCLADGIQLGCGCTFGKRNIDIIESDEIAVEFRAGEEILRIQPLPFLIQDGDDYEARIETAAEEMYSYQDEALFRIVRDAE